MIQSIDLYGQISLAILWIVCGLIAYLRRKYWRFAAFFAISITILAIFPGFPILKTIRSVLFWLLVGWHLRRYSWWWIIVIPIALSIKLGLGL